MTEKTGVLALDLSLSNTGWAVLSAGPTLVQTGTFTLGTRRKDERRAEWNLRRYAALRANVQILLGRFVPQVIAWEYQDKPFHAHWNSQTATAGSEFNAMSGLALAEGMLVGVLSEQIGLESRAVPRSEAKRIVTGNPNASKTQVRSVMAARYGWLLAGLTDDETDAAAIGLAVLEPALYQPLGDDMGRLLGAIRRGRRR